nr:hypothetical protein [Bacteroidales bacterium]
MFKLVSKKVAVRLFTVLSILFIIQTNAWGQAKVNGGNAVTTFSSCGSNQNTAGEYLVEFEKPNNDVDWSSVTVNGVGAKIRSTSNGSTYGGTVNRRQVYLLLPTGTATLTCTFHGGSADGQTKTIVITNTAPKLTVGKPNGVVSCDGSSITLDANVGGASGREYQISWDGGTNWTTTSQQSKTYTKSEVVNIVVRDKDNNSCQTSESVQISVVDLKAIKGVDMSATICDVSAAEIARPELPDGVTGTWTSNKNGSVVSNPNSNVTKFSKLESGETKFTWTVNYPGCPSATSTYTITNNSPSDARDISDVYVCPGDNSKSLGSYTSGATFTPTGVIGNDGKITISSLHDGANPITATYAAVQGSSCPAITKTFTIYKLQKPTITPNSETTVCGNDAVSITASPNPASYPAGTRAYWSSDYVDDKESYQSFIKVPAGESVSLKWNVEFPTGTCPTTSSDAVTIKNNAPSISLSASGATLDDGKIE